MIWFYVSLTFAYGNEQLLNHRPLILCISGIGACITALISISIINQTTNGKIKVLYHGISNLYWMAKTLPWFRRCHWLESCLVVGDRKRYFATKESRFYPTLNNNLIQKLYVIFVCHELLLLNLDREKPYFLYGTHIMYIFHWKGREKKELACNP